MPPTSGSSYAATRRVAISDPHYEYLSSDEAGPSWKPTGDFLVASSGQSSGDIRWYEYNAITGKDRNKCILADLPTFRTTSWSKHPSYDCLIACGTQSGKINLYALDPFVQSQNQTQPSQSHNPRQTQSQTQQQSYRDGANPYSRRGSENNDNISQFPHSFPPLPTGTTLTSSQSYIVGALPQDQKRPCTALAWFWPSRPHSAYRSAGINGQEFFFDVETSEVDGLGSGSGGKGNGNYLAAGYDKARSDPSLLIWDVERLLASSSSLPVSGSGMGIQGNRKPSRGDLEVDRLGSNIPGWKEKERELTSKISGGEGGKDSKPRTNNNHTPQPRPIQQYLSNEVVNSLDTFPHTINSILASYSSKFIRLIDLRVPTPTLPVSNNATTALDGTKTPTANQPKPTSNSTTSPTQWKANTKAVFNLSVCPDRPWLFASNEEGLGAIVRIWDTRYMPNSTSTTTNASTSTPGGAAASVGEILIIEAGGEGVASLKWENDDYLSGRSSNRVGNSSRTGRSRLGVATFSGGLTIWDVVSGERSDVGGVQGGRTGNRDRNWSVLAKMKRTEIEAPTSDLTGFAFLPTSSSSIQSTVSVHRDGKIGISHVRDATSIASSQQGDMTVIPRGLPILIPVESKIQEPKETTAMKAAEERRGRVQAPIKARAILGMAERSGPMDREEEDLERGSWADILSGDVALKMKAKAEAGFGMNLLANDPLEELYPISGNLLWEWFDRFVKLLGKSAVSSIEDYDFALQGICGIWNAAPSKEKEGSSTLKSNSLLLPLNYESEIPDWASSTRTPTNRSPAAGNRKSLDRREDVDYANGIEKLIGQRKAQFQDTTSTVKSAKPLHRQLMLAICGELSGRILDEEIQRISETNLTKAACLSYLNRGVDRALEYLSNSPDETHRLVGMLLISPQLNSTAVAKMQLKDPYLRAIIKSRAGDNSWGEITEDPELPLLERLVLALRFVGDDMLTIYLERMASSCMKNGSLHGIVLVGLTGRGVELLSRYVDRTGDLQSAAIIAAYMHRKTPKTTRWIEQYRDLLDSWKLYSPRIAFDMAHGQIAKSNGSALMIPPQIIVKCGFCGKAVTGSQARSQGIQAPKTRSSCCNSCGNRLPRCSICLLHIESPVGAADGPNYSVRSAAIFCMTCSHGGHHEHISRWFYGDGEDEEGHATCAVSGCNCRCAAL